MWVASIFIFTFYSIERSIVCGQVLQIQKLWEDSFIVLYLRVKSTQTSLCLTHVWDILYEVFWFEKFTLSIKYFYGEDVLEK